MDAVFPLTIQQGEGALLVAPDAMALIHGRKRYATRHNTLPCDLLEETWNPQNPTLLIGLSAHNG
jgi:hypothetical protein